MEITGVSRLRHHHHDIDCAVYLQTVRGVRDCVLVLYYGYSRWYDDILYIREILALDGTWVHS